MNKKENHKYLKDYVFSEEAKQIIESSSIRNEKGFDLWSFKKLIILEYYIKIFLQILENKEFKCFYIDFFAGSGASNLGESEWISLGSPILSLLKGVIPNKTKGINNRFTKWFFVENDNSFYESLKLRVSKTCKIIEQDFKEKLSLGKDIEIIQGDLNEKIDYIINKLRDDFKDSRVAILAFIDPYKFSDLEWNSLKKLLESKYVDIIFTLPTSTFKRGFDSCRNKEKYLSPSLRKLCENKPLSAIPEEKFSESYAKDIVEEVRRSICYYTKGIVVKNSNNVELYRVELFSHSQRAVEICEQKAKELQPLNYFSLETLFKQARGEQDSLNKYF